MKYGGVLVAGIGILISAIMFVRAMTMSVSLPGANVVNIHLMQQQEQLLLLSIIGLSVSIYFFVKGWRLHGVEILEASKAQIQGDASSVRVKYERKEIVRIALIFIGFAVAFFIFVLWSSRDHSMRRDEFVDECEKNYPSTRKTPKERTMHCYQLWRFYGKDGMEYRYTED